MNCCDYNCNQGRDCPARKTPAVHHELPITMEDDFMNFDWAMRWAWTCMAWFGFFAMIGLIAFFFGYKS